MLLSLTIVGMHFIAVIIFFFFFGILLGYLTCGMVFQCCFGNFFMLYFTDMSSQNKRSKIEITAARTRIKKWTIVIERVVVRQDVMVRPFNFIDQIFQENGWQSMFTCNKVYTRLVREFYTNLKNDQID